MYLMHNFYIFTTALFTSLIMVPAIRRWALDTGAVDHPNERKVHCEAVPRVGGVGIFIPFLFSLLVYCEMTREVRGILAGSLLVFFTGLIDDLYGLSARQKLVGQVGGCLVTVFVGNLYLHRLGDLFGLGMIELPIWAAIPVTIFSIVGVINALNLIDGLDGLASGISIIALSAFFVLGLLGRNFPVLAISSALLGGLLSFLKYNAFPARIFMGDTGSLVVGFLLGFLAVLLTQGEGGGYSPVLALLILALPITDTVLVMSSRVKRGKNPFQADQTHIHHRMLQLGYEAPVAVIAIYGISLLWSLLALILRNRPDALLFGLFWVSNLLFYVGLKLLLIYSGQKRRELPSRLGMDKSGLTLTGKPVQTAILGILLGLIAFYLLFASVFLGGTRMWALCLLPLVVLLGIGIPGFRNRASDLAYFGPFGAMALVIVFQMEQAGGRLVMQGITVNSFTNGLFVLISVVSGLYFLLWREFQKIFGSPLGFSVLAMSLSLSVVSPDFDISYNLSGVVSKSIVLLLAFKIIKIHSGLKQA